VSLAITNRKMSRVAHPNLPVETGPKDARILGAVAGLGGEGRQALKSY